MIHFVVMIGLMDDNIGLRHYYIHAMNVVVSFIFWVIKLPYEGHIITIEKLSYCDPTLTCFTR